MFQLRLHSVMVAAVLLGTCAASAADDGFKEITSESPHFVVEMPSDSEQLDVSKGTQTPWFLGSYDGVDYQLEVHDFKGAPASVAPQVSQRFMQWFRKRELDREDFDEDTEITLGASRIPGRAYRYTETKELQAGQQVGKCCYEHMYLDTPRLYILKVSTYGPWSLFETTAVKRFFSSFKLIDPVQETRPATPVPTTRPAAPARPAAESFRSVAGRYKVTFPARPEESTRQFGSQTEIYASVYVNALIYCVSYFELSANDTRGQNVRQILQRYQGGATVEDERELSPRVRGVRGREYSRDLSFGSFKSHGRYRQFLRGNRMYLVSVIGDAEKLNNPDVDAFLSSFGLTD